METHTAQQAPHRSLLKKINFSLVIIYFFTILVIAPTVYFCTKNEIYNRAQEDLILLVDVVKSIQDFVTTDLRPHFMQEGIFYSPSFSGIVATTRIAKYLKEKQPKFHIRNVSDNPLNADNQVAGMELDLLQQFQSDRNFQSLNQVGMINGQQYLVSAAPKINKKGCLRCHGIRKLLQ